MINLLNVIIISCIFNTTVPISELLEQEQEVLLSS